MNIEKAKQIPIEEVLKKMNYKPTKTNGFDFWFTSPFRAEKTPSFKVNTKLNRWYDHGIQKGGNLIDFIQMYCNLSISEVLRYLDNLSEDVLFSFQKQKQIINSYTEINNQINIVKIIEIQHFALKEYLKNRCIYFTDNEPNLKEIHYEINGKKYFAIGFKNRSLGYELRSKYTKICIGKKDITLIENQSDTICVFEGFIDYLSYKNSRTIFSNQNCDFLILNSIALINKCEIILNTYKLIELYLDNDTTGKNYKNKILSEYTNAIDKSSMYKEFKDLNDWLLKKR